MLRAKEPWLSMDAIGTIMKGYAWARQMFFLVQAYLNFLNSLKMFSGILLQGTPAPGC